MKVYKLISCLALICLFILMAFPAVASKKMLLKASLKNGFITLKAISNGGYNGKCLSLQLKNNTTKDITVTVDPALIFVPGKPVYQHLVAVGQEEMHLKAHEEKCFNIQTFCGKASAASPAPNVPYTYWKQGDSTMVLASRYIKDHGLFNSTGQLAIWMFTDKHKLSNVYNPYKRSAEDKAFVHYLAAITRQKVPEYYTYHKMGGGSAGTRVFDASVSKIYVELDWNKEHRRNLHIIVYNEHMEVYKVIETGQVSNSKGEHHIRITLDPAMDPSGKYIVQLKDDENNIWLEKTAMVGD